MVALCVESLDRVGCVIDDLQLALLVVVPVSAVQHAVSVSLLVAELTVISMERKMLPSRDAINDMFDVLTQRRCHNQICSYEVLPGHGSGKPPSEAENIPPKINHHDIKETIHKTVLQVESLRLRR